VQGQLICMALFCKQLARVCVVGCQSFLNPMNPNGSFAWFKRLDRCFLLH
jgi:hypothetical protein